MDEIKSSSNLRPRNREIRATYRREVLIQIILPFAVGLIIILALAVLAAIGPAGNQNQWMSVSLIWLLIPVIGGAFVIFIILAAMVYLVTRLIGVVPRYSLRVQSFTFMIEDKVRQICDTAVKPVEKVSGLAASIAALFGKQP